MKYSKKMYLIGRFHNFEMDDCIILKCLHLITYGKINMYAEFDKDVFLQN